VKITKCLDGRVDEPLTSLPIRNVVGVRDCFTTHGVDFCDHLFGGGAVVARSVGRSSEVVNDDLGPFSGEEKGVFSPNPASGSGNNRNASCQCTHEL
jgi:hypothetical protein